MHSETKLNKEDTWRPAELRRHISREKDYGDGHSRRMEDRRLRGGESAEGRHRDSEESRRDKLKERERRHGDSRDRHAERRKDGSRDRRGDKERERRDDEDRRKRVDGGGSNREIIPDKEDSRERERNRDRHKHQEKEEVKLREEDRDKRREDKEKERREDREKERGREDREKERRREDREKERRREDREKERVREDREKERRREDREKERGREDREKERGREDREKERRREDREKERRREDREKERRREDREKERSEDREKEIKREEQEREHRRERRHRDERGEVSRDETEKLHRDSRDQHHKGEHGDKRREKDVQEERRRSERREDGEEHRRRKEERERRHKERRHHDEKRKHESESNEHQDLKKSNDDACNARMDSDRAERENHRERSMKEEEDADRRHKDRRHREAEEVDGEKNHTERRSSSKKSSSDKNKEKIKDEEVASKYQAADGKHVEEDAAKEDFAAEEYEEDFEDYEEDFEDMDESADEGEDDGKTEGQTTQQSKEIEAVRRAMAEENERAGTVQSREAMSRDEEEEEEDRPKWSKGSERNESKTSRSGKFINFVAAKEREVNKKVATKQKKRGIELLRLIDLDFSTTFSLLDIPPVSEYEMYIKSFGNANTKQAYVQCNEDDADRDVQTEEVEVCEKWTQHPPEYSGACGDPNFSQDVQDKTQSGLISDSQSLMSFLSSASQVMVVLLEEGQAESRSLRKLETQTQSLSFSDGSLQLNTKLAFLSGRQISLVHFSQVQKHVMLSVHMPTAKPSGARLDGCTVVCIWNIWEPSRPQKTLICESEVQCCCFSPGKSTLVFGGTQVGSVVLWDLREQASNHYRSKIGEYEWTFRHPTFSTDVVMTGSGHVSPITSIEVVPSFEAGGLRSGVPLLSSEEESSGLSFQLASLDESGVLNFWVVVELPKGNEAGSPTDLGLRPGGRVKLLHSSSLLTVQRPSLKDAAKTRPFQTLLLKYHPTDSNHFFIGTNLGLVRHGTSHGLKALPQCYRFQEVEERTVDVTSIHFSPFRPNLFLVGCADGSIRLHSVCRDQPVAEWTNSTAGEAVISLQWTQTRPAVFCVLDAASNLHIWDMLKNDAQPVLTGAFTADRVTAIAVFGDSGQQNTYSGIALAHESGKIELQYFTPNLTVSSPADEGKLESAMSEAF